MAETESHSKAIVWRWVLIGEQGLPLLQSAKSFRTPGECVNDAIRFGYRERALPQPEVHDMR